MAVVVDNTELAVAAVPQIEGTSFLFDGGSHKTYTMYVECPDNVNGLLIWDRTQNTYTPSTNGTIYEFKCGANPEQFSIISSSSEKGHNESNVEKFIYNSHLYIRRSTQLYDASGRKL